MARLTVSIVDKQLQLCRGNITAVARHCKCTRQGVYDFMTHHPELKVTLKEARESMLDDAESILTDCVMDKNAWAVCFYLKTQGKERGYIEKSDDWITALIQQLTAKVAALEGAAGAATADCETGAAAVPELPE